MRKLLALCILFSILLSSCAPSQPVEAPQTKTDFSYGLWLSYSEIDALLQDENSFKSEFNTVLENLKRLKITNLYIHIRSHCDSIFESQYFPKRKSAQKFSYDVFYYMLEECHKIGIKVHAWINPYRVSTATADVLTLDHQSPAYKWHTDNNPENDKNILKEKGIYLNPAEFETRQLVIDGIKEVLNNYAVDGIHFDDYFYPTTNTEFDRESYTAYLETTKNPLSLEDWRRANVDTLISDCRTAIKATKKDVIFSISPAASIDNNYNLLYADVGLWIKNGYIDEIIPQLYFGFEHPDFQYRFKTLLKDWKKLCNNNKQVKLIIGLGAYKIGSESDSDGTEWQENTNLISRQTEICLRDLYVDGVTFFSYSDLFSAKPHNTYERENLIDIIENYKF